jgi:hypothetical protein
MEKASQALSGLLAYNVVDWITNIDLLHEKESDNLYKSIY